MQNETKDTFRKKCKENLEKIAKQQNKIALDSKLSQKLLNALQYEIRKIKQKKRSIRILLYYPLSTEFNIKKIIYFLRKKRNIEIFLPFMDNVSFKIVKYRLPLRKEKFSIFEPYDSQYFINNIDIAIIPALGIDNQFKRIGFGKGMYDRFFSTQKRIPRIIFVCRGLFYHSSNITQHHDIAGNFFITPFVALKYKEKKDDNLGFFKLNALSINRWGRKLPYFTENFKGKF